MEYTVRRRRFFEISAEILEICRTGARKTHVLYKANLSFKQLNSYTSILERSRLILYDAEKRLFRLTERGIRFLEDFAELQKLARVYNDKRDALAEVLPSQHRLS